MIYAQPRISPRKWDVQNSLGFWDTNGSPNLGQKTRPSDSKKKKKRNCQIVDYTIPADHSIKLKESEKYIDLARELNKTMEHEGDDFTNCNWRARYSQQRIGSGTGGLRNKRTSGDHPNYCIIEIGQNTEKSPGDLRRLTVIQAPLKDNQLKLVWKTLE